MYDLETLGLAYRKAKVDLYYTSHPSLEMIADYEHSLSYNLKELCDLLDRDDEAWVDSPSFLGTWTLATKSLARVDKDRKKEKFPPASNGELIYASPREAWKTAHEGLRDNAKIQAEFRLMARPSINFHVLSALWMLKVGCHYEKILTIVPMEAACVELPRTSSMKDHLARSSLI